MTTQSNGSDRTVVAAADLRTKQFYACKIDSSGLLALCSAAGENAYGVLQNNPNTGEPATVRVAGRTKWVAGGVIAPGGLVATDANGKAKAASLGSSGTGSYGMGIYVETANSASNQVIEVELDKMGLLPTTAAREADEVAARQEGEDEADEARWQSEREAAEASGKPDAVAEQRAKEEEERREKAQKRAEEAHEVAHRERKAEQEAQEKAAEEAKAKAAQAAQQKPQDQQPQARA